MSLSIRYLCFHWRTQFLIHLSSLPAGKSLPVPYLVTRTQLKGRVTNSKNPVAEETLGYDHGLPVLHSGACLQSSCATGLAEQLGAGHQFGSRHERPSHNFVRQRRCLPAHRRAHGTPREPLWFLTMVKGWGSRCFLAQMSALLPSFDEQHVQKMADRVEPLACQELGDEREKRGRGASHLG